MRFFVKLNGNFTSTFFSDHGRLVVVKANFKIITSRTNILHVALLTCNQVDDIFRFTAKNLRNRIRSASAGASKIITFL